VLSDDVMEALDGQQASSRHIVEAHASIAAGEREIGSRFCIQHGGRANAPPGRIGKECLDLAGRREAPEMVRAAEQMLAVV